MTLQVDIPRIFKNIAYHGMSVEMFDEELYSIRSRYKIIPKLIAKYASKFL